MHLTIQKRYTPYPSLHKFKIFWFNSLECSSSSPSDKPKNGKWYQPTNLLSFFATYAKPCFNLQVDGSYSDLVYPNYLTSCRWIQSQWRSKWSADSSFSLQMRNPLIIIFPWRIKLSTVKTQPHAASQAKKHTLVGVLLCHTCLQGESSFSLTVRSRS